MGIYVAGAAGLGALYAAIVGLGLWAALHGRKRASAGSQSHMILANRSVGLFLAIFSLVGKRKAVLELAAVVAAAATTSQYHAVPVRTIKLRDLCHARYIHVHLICICLWAASILARAQKASPASLSTKSQVVFRKVVRSLARPSHIPTCVGDTLVHGTADAMFSRGLAWCQVPIGYGLSLLFGALLFAKPMRKAEYVTMLDPFQQHYGARVGGLMFLPALCGDLFWSAALLRALGLAVSLVAGIETTVGVGVTVLAIALYTATGGLYSLLWTSALQLVCLTAGLALAAPYAALHPAVAFEKSLLAKDWLGGIRDTDVGEWLDTMLLAIFGGIPWQSYFQRILSIKCPRFARTVSIAAMFGCLALAVPSAMIGIIARDTNWPQVEQAHGSDNSRIVASAASSPGSSIWRNSNGGGDVLPMVLRYLTPRWVAYAGLGAIACGIMASADSSIFSVSSMFSRNVYKMTMRPKVKRAKLFNKCDILYVRLEMREKRELDWILRISIAVVSFLSAAVALSVSSVNYLAFLCADFVYVVLFPQLVSVIHWPKLVDSYGCLAGYAVAVVVRISGGEKSLGIPTFVEYPFYDHQTHKQKFPFRSTAMLASVFVQLTVSFFTRNLLGQGYLPGCCDVLSVYAPNAKNPANGVAPSSSGAALLDCTLNDASPGHMSDATTLSSSRTDYDASSTDTQLQTPTTPQQVSIIYGGGDSSTLGRNHNAAHKANQALHNLRESMSPKMTTATVASRPGLHHSNSLMGTPTAGGQILGVKGLQLTPAHMADCPQAPVPPRIMSPTTPISLPPYAKAIPTTIITNGRLEGDKNQCGGDRSNMELSLNLTDGSGIVKKNIKGVKLIGMDGSGGGTLRRPSLQGTFSPTPSVEMVNIFDRRQSSGSFGPSSLSPIPGVEACKTHGTAMGNGGAGGHVGNEHCRIKRGIVRHHSFNDTGDRNLTTLARQPTYPSMPLNSLVRKGGGGNDSLPPTTPTSQTTMMTTMQRRNCSSLRYSSLADEHSCQAVDAAARLHATLRRDNRNCKSMIHHGTMGRSHHATGSTGNYLDDKSVSLVGHLLVSPTYGMYNSAVKTGSYDYFVGNDEAVSRF
uniref:High-affinity choline transporter 1 n=1 Tax=Trichogramma kaykai TaxID=54128 RepID=A0ABD2XBT3_9HYME